MTRSGINLLFVGLLVLAAGPLVSRADTKGESPDFQEVYQLIKTHVPGVSDAELNRAAVQGLFTALGPKVLLVTNGMAKESAAETPRLKKAAVLENGIAYLRVVRVAEGLAKEISEAIQQLGSTNKLKGIVLDLRYAAGTDYAAAVTAADLFVGKAQPLLNWGNGVVSAPDNTNAIQLPVAMLVNHGTSGAAEALAAILRSTGAGLILGGQTAGEAMITQDFPLKGDAQLRVATAPVILGNGTSLSLAGLKPDIDVRVGPDDERAYYADAFYVMRKPNLLATAALSATNNPDGTNTTRRVRFNEAELVREHREGTDRENDSSRHHADGLVREHREGMDGETSEPGLEYPLVNDPVLARALDLLKGLAVVRQSRS
jgi:hypothetical protein